MCACPRRAKHTSSHAGAHAHVRAWIVSRFRRGACARKPWAVRSGSMRVYAITCPFVRARVPSRSLTGEWRGTEYPEIHVGGFSVLVWFLQLALAPCEFLHDKSHPDFSFRMIPPSRLEYSTASERLLPHEYINLLLPLLPKSLPPQRRSNCCCQPLLHQLQQLDACPPLAALLWPCRRPTWRCSRLPLLFRGPRRGLRRLVTAATQAPYDAQTGGARDGDRSHCLQVL